MGVFHVFLNCTNGAKSHNTSHMTFNISILHLNLNTVLIYFYFILEVKHSINYSSHKGNWDYEWLLQLKWLRDC